MAKKFSIITLDEKEIFIPGFIEPVQLCDSDSFIDIMMTISPTIKVPILIEHCLILDYPGNNVDISLDDLEVVLERFDYFLENDYIFCESEIKIEMNGLGEDEYLIEC